jgi:hypothetical protein
VPADAQPGWWLFALVIAGGLYLVSLRGLPLLLIGLAGVVLGWGYSAPPLRLNSRGLGSQRGLVLLLLPQGMAVLLSGYWLPSLLWASLPFAILTSLLLYINQFPDREADRLAGKWHWVVRLPLARARAGYGLLVVLAYGLLAMLLWQQRCRYCCAGLADLAVIGLPACSCGGMRRTGALASGHHRHHHGGQPVSAAAGRGLAAGLSSHFWRMFVMIGRLSGNLIEKLPPQVVVDVNGVGYEVDVPMTTFYQLPALGQKTTLFTHLVVREDAHLLFGFASKEERQTFRQLIKVSGIGAKIALAILSGMTADELAVAIASEDIKRCRPYRASARKLPNGWCWSCAASWPPAAIWRCRAACRLPPRRMRRAISSMPCWHWVTTTRRQPPPPRACRPT